MPRSLLVVDDSSTVQEAVRLALTGEDWTLRSASGSVEAAEAIRAAPPDAILCDVSLGQEDGYEVCRRLKDGPEGRAAPVILMGGRVSEGLAAAAGASGTLLKPFAAGELLSALEASLAAGALGLELEDVALPAETGPSEPAAPEAVEVIDLSDQEGFDEVELLEDLEPLGPELVSPSAESAPEPGGRQRPGAFDLAPGLEPSGGGSAEAAGAASAFGDLELPPVDLGGDADDAAFFPTEPGREEPRAGTAAPSPAEPGPDLLGNIDLEDLSSPATTSRTEEEVRICPESFHDRAAEGTAPDRTPAPCGEMLPEPSAGASPPETAPPEPSADRIAPPVELGVEPTDEFYAWTPAEPSAGAPSPTADDEPEPPAPEPVPPPQALAEPWLAPAEAVAPAAGEAGLRAASGAGESDPGWTRPEPAPAPEIPWDLAAREPEPLASAMAARVEAAVHEALRDSLSSEKLAPVVEAAVERAVWQIVPQLAERLIRETIEKLREAPPAG